MTETGSARPAPAPPPGGFVARVIHRAEDVVAVLALLVMASLPIAEAVGRGLFEQGVPGSIQFVQNLTLWIAFLGAMIASRQRRHLALATASFVPAALRGWTSLFASMVNTAVVVVLARSAYEVVRLDSDSVAKLAFGIPQWYAEVIMPVGFAIIALRFWWQSGEVPISEGHDDAGAEVKALPAWHAWARRAAVLAAVGALWAFASIPEASVGAWRWPLVGVIIAATALGTPIFVALGGLAVVLFFADPGSGAISSILTDTYRVFSQPTLPTIPLFTLAGSLLAQGGTPARLVRVFRAFAGWLPGGTAVAAVLVCAFFTTFTGASGVTILALGALLFPVLVADVYGERFSLGAITAAGSIGLLFPPSLPVILYGISAMVPINELFVAAIAPGFVLVGLTAAFCMYSGVRAGAGLRRPDPREMLASIWDAKWEVLLPVVVFASLFGGFATTVEAAALTALYAFAVKFFIYRDIGFRRDLARVFRESAVLVGGVLIILGCALGLTGYLIMAQVPDKGAAFVEATIHSKWAFLLALNLFLIVVGMLMDIFSAIFVVVPLILPIAAVFQIDPLHLGVIFLINLELGYLTPPVGLNLFLSSYRFNRPMAAVVRAILPFAAVQATSVLLVTFLPQLSVGVVEWLMR